MSTKAKNARYSKDPYWTVARFPSKCAKCGDEIKAGAKIFYYPATRSVYCEKPGCGGAADADFQQTAFDEDVYNSNPVSEFFPGDRVSTPNGIGYITKREHDAKNGWLYEVEISSVRGKDKDFRAGDREWYAIKEMKRLRNPSGETAAVKKALKAAGYTGVSVSSKRGGSNHGWLHVYVDLPFKRDDVLAIARSASGRTGRDAQDILISRTDKEPSEKNPAGMIQQLDDNTFTVGNGAGTQLTLRRKPYGWDVIADNARARAAYRGMPAAKGFNSLAEVERTYKAFRGISALVGDQRSNPEDFKAIRQQERLNVRRELMKHYAGVKVSHGRGTAANWLEVTVHFPAGGDYTQMYQDVLQRTIAASGRNALAAEHITVNFVGHAPKYAGGEVRRANPRTRKPINFTAKYFMSYGPTTLTAETLSDARKKAKTLAQKVVQPINIVSHGDVVAVVKPARRKVRANPRRRRNAMDGRMGHRPGAGSTRVKCAECGHPESQHDMDFDWRCWHNGGTCGCRQFVATARKRRRTRNPIEYKRVDTTTEKGLREAERLHQAGWKTVRVTPFLTEFERRSMTPQQRARQKQILAARQKNATPLSRHQASVIKREIKAIGAANRKRRAPGGAGQRPRGTYCEMCGRERHLKMHGDLDGTKEMLLCDLCRKGIEQHWKEAGIVKNPKPGPDNDPQPYRCHAKLRNRRRCTKRAHRDENGVLSYYCKQHELAAWAGKKVERTYQKNPRVTVAKSGISVGAQSKILALKSKVTAAYGGTTKWYLEKEKGGTVLVHFVSGSGTPRESYRVDGDTLVHTVYGTRNPAGKRGKTPMRKRNGDYTREAAQMYKSFHGESAKQLTEIVQAIEETADFAKLGDLRKLIISTAGAKFEIEFDQDEGDKNNVILASDPAGKQLYIIGGDQNVDDLAEELGLDLDKDQLDLGEIEQVEYFTRKGFDDFKPVTYFHKMGEEGGELPLLVYDTKNEQLHVVGGSYVVKPEGITN
jgi:hypothetical protein